MFETQYNELALAVDLIAERIRALGHPAPATYADFLRLSSVKEDKQLPRAKDMIKNLLADHETVAKSAHKLLPLVSESSDEATADLLTQRLHIHEKTAWMLRSLLEE
jgi:starvation-inducible DNA-binding protein